MSPPVARVAVLDDEPRMAEVLAMVLRREGHEVRTWTDPAAFLAWLAVEVGGPAAPAALLSDLRMPGIDGLETLHRVRQLDPDLPVILVTAHGAIDVAVQAIRAGAWDFLEKPVDNERCRLVVGRALAWSSLARENRGLRQRLMGDAPVLVGASAALRSVDAQTRAMARARLPVLLTGETGTGKELVARLLHTRSPRAAAPFLAVNCAAIAPGLLESELFGHDKGAYTGADRGRAGVFERADGGTLFLDEVGEIDAAFQARLLRVLQEGELTRVGGDQLRRVDVRIVAATHRDLQADVAAGRFREDLYYRLAVLPLHIPPLRERKDDVLPLAFHFLERARREQGRQDLQGWGEGVEAWLLDASWPGNARQLRNCMDRAAVLAPGPLLEVTDLLGPPGAARTEGDDLPLAAWLDQQTATRVRLALSAAGGVRVEAAARLGVDRTTLFRLMKRLEIDG